MSAPGQDDRKGTPLLYTERPLAPFLHELQADQSIKPGRGKPRPYVFLFSGAFLLHMPTSHHDTKLFLGSIWRNNIDNVTFVHDCDTIGE